MHTIERRLRDPSISLKAYSRIGDEKLDFGSFTDNQLNPSCGKKSFTGRDSIVAREII